MHLTNFSIIEDSPVDPDVDYGSKLYLGDLVPTVAAVSLVGDLLAERLSEHNPKTRELLFKTYHRRRHACCHARNYWVPCG